MEKLSTIEVNDLDAKIRAAEKTGMCVVVSHRTARLLLDVLVQHEADRSELQRVQAENKRLLAFFDNMHKRFNDFE